MALAFPSYNILPCLVKDWIEIFILLEDLWMYAPRKLITCHTSTLTCPLSLVASRSVPASSVTSLKRDNFKQQTEKEYLWLDHTRRVLESENESLENTSWAAYHASHQSPESNVICPTALLPLFLESAHTVAMIKHSFCVVKSAVDHLNPGQTPVITFDQPLYALAKEIQWKWPEDYGEDKFVIMFGGLHIEMAALKTLGDWLKGSGWVQALVQAEIATAGTADSFLHAAHVTRTRRVHQVTVAALNILKHRAYDSYHKSCTRDGQDMLGFKQWRNQREQVCPHFQYWAIVMELEICVLVFIRSLRLGSFPMYLDALTELVSWFHALDHTNYARWIPVHLRDMAQLSMKNPDVAKEFNEGLFERPTECSLQSLLIMHTSRTMPTSKEMEELLGSLTTQVPFDVGWLRDQKWQG